MWGPGTAETTVVLTLPQLPSFRRGPETWNTEFGYGVPRIAADGSVGGRRTAVLQASDLCVQLYGIWTPSRNYNFSSLVGFSVTEIRNYVQIPCSCVIKGGALRSRPCQGGTCNWVLPDMSHGRSLKMEASLEWALSSTCKSMTCLACSSRPLGDPEVLGLSISLRVVWGILSGPTRSTEHPGRWCPETAL